MRIMYFIFLLLAILVAPVNAAIYYIDYATGADTNNGTSTSTPFKRCPGDPAATDTALATTLAAGDKVIFKGGVTYYTNVGGLTVGAPTYSGGIKIN